MGRLTEREKVAAKWTTWEAKKAEREVRKMAVRKTRVQTSGKKCVEAARTQGELHRKTLVAERKVVELKNALEEPLAGPAGRAGRAGSRRRRRRRRPKPRPRRRGRR